MNWAKAEEILKSAGADSYRLKQLRHAVFKESVSSYAEISSLPAELRAHLEKSVPLLVFTDVQVSVSGDKRAHKALASLQDGRAVETVLLRPSSSRWTCCISSQVGCAVGCPFCATGSMGFLRHLSSEEITDQVLFWRQYLKKIGSLESVDNIVYMGMGEPFAAYEPVGESLKALTDPQQFGIGARHISVSTAGIAPQIERFGIDFPQVNLAVSLHSADDKIRTKLVPINKAYPLKRLAEAMKKYMSATKRKIFIEYVLLKGENDSLSDAAQLTAYLRSVGPLERLHVNLILFNETGGSFKAPEEASARRFQGSLLAAGLKATVRQNLGRDIAGACGQLAVKAGAEKAKA